MCAADQESSDETDHVASLPTEQGQERREEASFHARREWQEGEEGVELEWMEWAKKGFNQPFPAGYLNKRTVKLGENEFIVFDVASGVDTVIEYFIITNNIVFRLHDSRLGNSENEMNKDIISTFTFTK